MLGFHDQLTFARDWADVAVEWLDNTDGLRKHPVDRRLRLMGTRRCC